jgi:NAD(P)-dependent dehydrogenase (short-subunit alcohol dehydrogenase family)
MPLNPPIRDWRAKRVWLVGASTGIGRALASRLHGLGAQVVVSARTADALSQFVKAHPGSLAVPVDVTDAASVRGAAARVLATGTPDLVCLCAAHYRPVHARAFDLAQCLQHNEVNTVGTLRVLGAVLPAMLDREQGHVSLVASVAGYRGLPRSLAYGPTKAALIHLAEVLHLELAPVGLGVSLVNPGFVDTPLTAINDFPMPARIGADEAALRIVGGWEQGSFEIHFPRRFTAWIRLLRLLPYRLYFPVVRRFTGG